MATPVCGSNPSSDDAAGRGAIPARVANNRVAIPIPMADPSLSLLRRRAAAGGVRRGG